VRGHRQRCQLLASASDDRTVWIWDPKTGRCVLTLPAYHAAIAITSVAESVGIGLDAGILVIELGSVT
jgi:WD40 repeat protein